MKCLSCQSDLIKRMYENVEIDVCPNCRGVWLDSGELTKIVETIEHKFSEDAVSTVIKRANPDIPGKEYERQRHCPKCNNKLEPNNYQYNSGIVVDLCTHGHGVWLDRGEMAAVQIHDENAIQEYSKKAADWFLLAEKSVLAHKTKPQAIDTHQSIRQNVANQIKNFLNWLLK